MKIFLYFLVPLFVLTISCGEDDPVVEPECGSFIVIDASGYNKVSHPIAVHEALIEDNCLTTTFSFSGCDDDVSVTLVDKGKVSQDTPPVRQVKLLVSDAGDCAAVFSKTAIFDLSPALIAGQPNLHFDLAGWDYNLVYQPDPIAGKCDDTLLVSPDAYKKDSHPVDIRKVTVGEDCLELTFSFSGCTDDVGMRLVDMGAVAESNPVQRWLKLIVDDAGLCEAAFVVTKSFDLSPVQARDGDTIIFHLDGWEEPFRYDF